MPAVSAKSLPQPRARRFFSPSIRIEGYRPAHFDAIFRIETAVFYEDRYRRELFSRMCRDNRELLLVARVNARVAGYAMGEIIPSGAEIVSIAVSRRFRGRGVGRRLMQRLLARMRSEGLSRVFLMVREDNARAISLYRSLGFRRVRRVEEYYADGQAAIRMRLQLE